MALPHVDVLVLPPHTKVLPLYDSPISPPPKRSFGVGVFGFSNTYDDCQTVAEVRTNRNAVPAFATDSVSL